MNDFLTTVIGANWRTTIAGHFAILAVAIATAPASLPSDWHNLNQVILFAAWCIGIISGSAFSFSAKDKQVVGNGTINEPNKTPDGKGGNNVISPLIAAILIPWFFVSLSGCANFTAWTQNPNTATALADLFAGGLAYSQGNDTAAAINGIQGAAALLRSLQSTPQAASPSAVSSAVATGGAPALAPLVANAVTQSVSAGASPDAANEVAAKILDSITAKK